MLDGVFSFVLLDTRDNSFLAARDAIGITPLYIGWGLDGKIQIFQYVARSHQKCRYKCIIFGGSEQHNKLEVIYVIVCHRVCVDII